MTHAITKWVQYEQIIKKRDKGIKLTFAERNIINQYNTIKLKKLRKKSN